MWQWRHNSMMSWHFGLRLELVRDTHKILVCAKNQLFVNDSFFNQFWTYKQIYTHIYISIYTIKTGLICTSTLRLLGRFTTCLAQTTTASRLLFDSTRHFVPREFEKIENIVDFLFFYFFSNFVTSWWRNNSVMSHHIWDLWRPQYLYHKSTYNLWRFRVSIS